MENLLNFRVMDMDMDMEGTRHQLHNLKSSK